jgi:hypothetical protein
VVTAPRIFIFLDFSNDLSYLYCRTAKPLDGEIIFVKETIDMEKKESEFVAYSVLSENECGKGTYTLYVQSIRVEGRYMIMFKSDDREELKEVADRINEVRHSIYKNRRDKENIEAYVV